MLAWLVEHALALSVVQLLSCLPCIAIALGMLRRQPLARTGFIVVLLLTAVLNLGSLPLLDRLLMDLMQGVAELGKGMDLADAMQEIAPARTRMWAVSSMSVLLLAVMHAWLAWRYTRADMRQLYRR